MNIFFLSRNIEENVRFRNNAHVVKMILEYTQLLSSVHHITHPDPSSIESIYKLTHKNHPDAVWARSSSENYFYLYSLAVLLGEEYTHRYNKIHKQKDWTLVEPPKAYTWDPESKQFFESLEIGVEIKESYYTSVHYVVRPRLDSPLCCEIQVRTLFEEIWGEVDHTLNYPTKSENLACREQLKVLAKLVGAGSRLVDSIFRSEKSNEI